MVRGRSRTRIGVMFATIIAGVDAHGAGAEETHTVVEASS
jgi:hypothetical protein